MSQMAQNESLLPTFCGRHFKTNFKATQNESNGSK